MATIVEFTTDVDHFPLGTIFSALSEVTVELERVVPKSDWMVPYFWVEGADVTDIVAQFSDHSGVRDIQVIDNFVTHHLMKCEWVPEHKGILTGLTESDVTLLESVGTEDGWHFQIRGNNADAVSRFRQYCEEHDVPIEITAVYTQTEPTSEQSLTDTQKEALRLAYERGYFDSPRTATLTEIADELGISQQALSSRIQRGTRRLIANTGITSA